MTPLARVTAPHFVAGVIVGRRAAPILVYMMQWSVDGIAGYCRSKGWRMETV